MNLFPPVEDALLEANPKFAALYRTLTTKFLRPDGSSNNPAQAERDATIEALRAHRIRAAKWEILRTAICALPLTASSGQQPLPPDLVELIILLSLRLSASTPQQSLVLLSSTDVYASLRPHLPRIGELLSGYLHRHALLLARLLNPTTNPSFLHRTIPKIPDSISSLQSDIDAKKAATALSRLALIPLTSKVLVGYRDATELAIRILEQTKHGLLARSAAAKSELLKLQAQVEELNAKNAFIAAQNAVYTPEVIEALRNYTGHLRDARSRLRQREKDAEMELSRYGFGREPKEKVMKEIARVYGQMTKEVEEVKKDLERLGVR